MEVAGRADKARARMAEAGCEALLVSNLVNVRYLTGFSGSAGMLLLRPHDAVLVTDGRYALQAPAELARSGVVAQVHALPAAEQLSLLPELTAGLAMVGLEADHITWALQRRYARTWGRGKRLVPTTGVVEELRRRKDAGEVARIAAAAGIADQAFTAVAAMLEAGPTEAEVAAALDAGMRRLGAEAAAFETIVASGPNGAEPHHRPGGRRVALGDLVVVDFGARVEGYCSDMTRTVRAGAPGDVGEELRRVAQVVLASQDAGLSAVRDGAAGSEVDRACREVVEAAGWGEYFVHGTGHGVGLDIHEAPSLARSSADILGSGQVVTVEPGVYVPGLGGARTEDTVVVTEAGCEVLTLTPKQAQLVVGERRRRHKRQDGARAH
jgi:Xaa-Pro aminopeptidase